MDGNILEGDFQVKARLRRTIIVACSLATFLFVGSTAHYLVWPDLEPAPSKVGAIIELGGPGDRDAAALSLARSKRAPYLIQSTTELEAGTNLCLPPTPGVTVLCFNPDPGTTRGEARYIGHLALQYHWDSVILVTSTDQALRAHLRVSRCFPGRVFVSTTSPPIADWLYLIPYQWAAFVKALFFETTC